MAGAVGGRPVTWLVATTARATEVACSSAAGAGSIGRPARSTPPRSAWPAALAAGSTARSTIGAADGPAGRARRGTTRCHSSRARSRNAATALPEAGWPLSSDVSGKTAATNVPSASSPGAWSAEAARRATLGALAVCPAALAGALPTPEDRSSIPARPSPASVLDRNAAAGADASGSAEGSGDEIEEGPTAVCSSGAERTGPAGAAGDVPPVAVSSATVRSPAGRAG
jgi:hypothetical protein